MCVHNKGWLLEKKTFFHGLLFVLSIEEVIRVSRSEVRDSVTQAPTACFFKASPIIHMILAWDQHKEFEVACSRATIWSQTLLYHL